MHRHNIQNIYSLPDIIAIEKFNKKNKFQLGTSKYLGSPARPMESETLAMSPSYLFQQAL